MPPSELVISVGTMTKKPRTLGGSQSPNKPDFDVFAPVGCHLQLVVDGYV